MSDLNNYSCIGRLGADPVLKRVGDHDKVEFRIAITQGFGDHKGTCWIDCELWGKRAATLAGHFHKGKPIALSGELRMDSWEAKDGTKRTKHVIRATGFNFVPNNAQEDRSQPKPRQEYAPAHLDDSELPF